MLCIVALGGCDVAKFTADSTAGLFTRAAPAFESYWDYELAGEAMPASIVQFEGILRVVPDNEAILTQLTQAYMGYAYGWVEADVEDVLDELEDLTTLETCYAASAALPSHQLLQQATGATKPLITHRVLHTAAGRSGACILHQGSQQFLSIDHRPALLQRDGERLLDVDILARVDRRYRLDRVPMVRSGYDHCIKFFCYTSQVSSNLYRAVIFRYSLRRSAHDANYPSVLNIVNNNNRNYR